MSNETQTRTYCPITAEGFQGIRADLAKNGISLPDENDSPPEGVLGSHGFVVRWHYEPAVPGKDGWLRIELDGTGWMMNMAWDKIEPHVKPYVKV